MLKIMKKEFGSGSTKKTVITDESLSSDYVQKIIMHSYSGSVEIAQSMAKLQKAEIYFSFSLLASQKSFEIMQSQPEDRILLETDSPCQYNQEFDDGKQSLHSFLYTDHCSNQVKTENQPAFIRNFIDKKLTQNFVNNKTIISQILKNSYRIINSL